MPENIAMATVTSDDFVPGTLTMIESFRAQNPWFEGDVIVINRTLNEHSKAVLHAFDPNLIHRPVSQELARRMSQIADRLQWKTGKELQFGSVEATTIAGYDRIIFCDSDLLFLDTIEEITTIDAPLIACGDGAFFRGNRRRLSDFVEIDETVSESISRSMGNTFNSGMIIIDTRRITSDDLDRLVARLDPALWRDDRTGHTDQMVLNLHFAGWQHLVPPTYNFLLSHRALIKSVTGLSIDDAKVLHFTGPEKPWVPFEKLSSAGLDQDYFAAFAKWNSVYTDLCRRRGIARVKPD